MTGALNRAGLKEGLESLHKDEIFCAVLIDVDHFKDVNDTHGHAVGDQVLNSLVDIVCCNISKQDFVARLGGDEFAIILRGVTVQHAYLKADIIRTTFAETMLRQYRFGRIPTLSLGVAKHSVGSNHEQLLKNADKALYRSKNSGRNRVEVHELRDQVA